MKYDLVIFDLDGTILNTLEDLADSTNYALEHNGLPAVTLDEVRSFVGNGIAKLIERAVPEKTAPQLTERVLETFKEYYKLHCADKTRPYDGVEQMFDKLREKNIRTAVISNKADFAVQSLCRDYFPGAFDCVAGEREGIRRKPYPDSVSAVMERLGIAKERTLYVGDSEVDIQTAANAGIDEAAVTWGFREETFLREQGAVTVVDSVQELLAYILQETP